jgi:AcrR family transcriptional regulator
VRGRVGAVSARADRAALTDGLARGGVPEIQRARIVAALVEVAREHGARGLTVAHIVGRSGVSRRTFYEIFEDRDACFLAAFEDAIERGAARVVPAFTDTAGAWHVRIRAGLLSLLEFLDEDPGLASLCIVDALAAGHAVLAQRARIVETLVAAVEEGRGVARTGLQPTRLTAEGVVGAVLALLYARLAEPIPEERPERPLVELLNPLMGIVVLPYLGPAGASREAAREAPEARPRVVRPRGNPIAGLDMRLTYRTVRVLIAIAAQADASNRQVADAAGVHDQGQISKLLARLEHLGLIENAGSGQSHGAPNAWRLTARGHEVQLTLSQ